jgi:hypothetical protein
MHCYNIHGVDLVLSYKTSMLNYLLHVFIDFTYALFHPQNYYKSLYPDCRSSIWA